MGLAQEAAAGKRFRKGRRDGMLFALILTAVETWNLAGPVTRIG
jgi:hypothetical protein